MSARETSKDFVSTALAWATPRAGDRLYSMAIRLYPKRWAHDPGIRGVITPIIVGY